MDKEVYTIHLDDYLNHIDNKLEMYELLLEMVRALRSDLDNDSCAQVVRTLCGYEQQAHEMFEEWGIPDEYRQTGEAHHLAQLMEEELLPAEDEEAEDGSEDDCAGKPLSVLLLRTADLMTRSATTMLEASRRAVDAEFHVLMGRLDETEKPENDCAG